MREAGCVVNDRILHPPSRIPVLPRSAPGAAFCTIGSRAPFLYPFFSKAVRQTARDVRREMGLCRVPALEAIGVSDWS